jgi:hypothetical protein
MQMNTIFKCEPIPSKGMYRVCEDVDIQGVHIEAGFEWNGANIPRLAWTFVGITPFDPRIMRASCVHDYLVGVGEPLSHSIFYEAMLADGLSKEAAQLFYNAVVIEVAFPSNDEGPEYPDGLL